MFSSLCKVLIFREFVSERESARKYSLIFGVELKTRTKISQHTENLKVPRINFFQHKATTLIRRRSRSLLS